LYSDTITISIPGRFSAYSDHLIFDESKAEQDTQFTVSGVFITPEDGLVYYSSDRDAFKIDGGKGAKTQGHYLCYDSDDDGFAETVFVLSPTHNSDRVYDVMAIGFNYDGSVEFAPHTKVDVSEEVILNDNFYDVFAGRKNEKHGDWVYNFNSLKTNRLIFPPDTYDGYELKDSLFEIYKLVEVSKQEFKYPTLFYEARHKAYNKAWLEYGQQFWRDVGDQCFSTLIAGGVSLAIMTSSLGLATPLAHFAYFVLYSLISKFQMDLKANEADAYQKSQTFYPESAKHDAPTELSQKPYWDGFWGDSMPTALSGHQGAYFTTVYGGTPGNEYSAQAVVVPADTMRFWGSDFSGVSDFIGANLNPFSFGRANPDLFTPLDFDHHNLDYQLVSSELYSYNDIPSYNYVESEKMVDYFLDGEKNYPVIRQIFGGMYIEYYAGPEYAMQALEYNDYYKYRKNTLGYLTRAIKIASEGQFVGIKPYCDDGRPSYVFTEDTQFMADMPLFEPLIVDQDAYERLEEQGKVDGFLLVDLSVDDASFTKGISPTRMSSIELEHYGAKIPLADHFGGFGYPVKNVTLHAMVDGVPVASIDLTSDQYAIDGLGNLYFYSPVDHLLPTFLDNKVYRLSEEHVDYSGLETHYTCVIKIAKVIPDTGVSDLSSSALMQSVMYSIMDYMDVYTFGETTANMIAEIGYTQAMTITSTAITAPLLALGAWATLSTQEVQKQVTTAVVNTAHQTVAQQASQEVAKITFGQTIQKLLGSKTLGGLLTQIAVKTTIGVVSETIEEIVIDGLVETFFQSLVEKLGYSADLGHWVSTLMTTARETKFFSSFFSSGGETSQISDLVQDLAVADQTISDMNQNAENMIGHEISEQFLETNSLLETANQEATLSFKKLLKAGLLVGISLIMPSMAGLNLYAISKAIGGTINQAYTSSVIKPQVQELAKRNMMVSGEALSKFEYVNIEGLFYEKPIMDTILETASPTVETMNSISTPLSASAHSFPTSFASRMRSASVFYSPKDNLNGGYITPNAIKEVDDMKKDLKNKIKENIKKLEAIKGEERTFDAESEIGNIMLALKSKEVYDTTQLFRIERALIEIKNQMVDGVPVLDSASGKYGALNLKILEVVEDKINTGEELTSLEREIFTAKVLLTGNRVIFRGKYPPLHIKAEFDKYKYSSPFYNHFADFLEKINDIIINEPTLRINARRYDIPMSEQFKHLSTILNFQRPSIFLDFLNRMNLYKQEGIIRSEGSQFDVGEYTLDVWYTKIGNFVKEVSGVRYDNIMSRIDTEFSKIYKKFGYEGIHPLYRNARLTIAKIGEVLLSAGTITINKMNKMNELSEGILTQGLYKTLVNNPYGTQRRSTIINLVDKILTGAKKKDGFTLSLEEKIISIRNDYSEKLESYLKGLDILKDYRPTYRKKLIEVIVGNCDILQSIDTIKKLSWILFGDKNLDYKDASLLSNFLSKSRNRDKSRPQIHIMVNILDHVSKWDKKQFSEIGLAVSNKEIKNSIEKINKIVERWIESAHIFSKDEKYAPYTPLSLVNIKDLTDSSSNEKYRLISSLWYVCALKENNALTFDDIQARGLLGSKKISLLDILEGKSQFNKRFLKGALASIKSWINEEAEVDLKSRKIRFYLSTISQIGYFALTNRISLKGSGGEKIFNGRKFEEEYIMAYHVFTGLGKHLGIDPLTLGVINDKIFKITDKELNTMKSQGISIYRWLRHHFRDSIAGRISFLHSDVVITDQSNHVFWESLTESESLAVIRGFEKLIEMKGSGNAMKNVKGNIILDAKGNIVCYEITLDDIMKAYEGNEWVVAKWLSQEKFEENLEAFNERRLDIRIPNMGLKGLIEKNNPIAYERFSKILEDGRDKFDSFMLELHNDLDASDLASKEVIGFLREYLKEEGYLVQMGSFV